MVFMLLIADPSMVAGAGAILAIRDAVVAAAVADAVVHPTPTSSMGLMSLTQLVTLPLRNEMPWAIPAPSF